MRRALFTFPVQLLGLLRRLVERQHRPEQAGEPEPVAAYLLTR